MNGICRLPLAAWLRALLVSLLLSFAAPAAGAVEVTFYSKEFGVTFPHAFIRVSGTLDSSGEKVDASYGFTAKTISPAILFGSVTGEIIASAPDYIAHSDPHFSLVLSDEDYRRLLARVDAWRRMEQPSYNLNRRNCVFFVADLARALGMKADTPKRLMKKPRSYLDALVSANLDWLRQHHATIAQ